MNTYKPYSDKFQGFGTNVDLKRYEESDFKVLGNFYDKDGKLHTADLAYNPVEYTTDGGTQTPKTRTCKLMFEDKNNLNDSYAQEIGGGTFAHSNITAKFEQLTKSEEEGGDGCTIDYIICKNTFVKYNAYKPNNVLYRSATINSQGYITNTYGIGKKTSQFIIEYNSEPKTDNYVSMASRNIGINGTKATYTTNIMQPIKMETEIIHKFFFKTKTLSDKNISLEKIRIYTTSTLLTACKNIHVYKNNIELQINVGYTIANNDDHIVFTPEIIEPNILIEVDLEAVSEVSSAMIVGYGVVQQ